MSYKVVVTPWKHLIKNVAKIFLGGSTPPAWKRRPSDPVEAQLSTRSATGPYFCFRLNSRSLKFQCLAQPPRVGWKVYDSNLSQASRNCPHKAHWRPGETAVGGRHCFAILECCCLRSQQPTWTSGNPTVPIFFLHLQCACRTAVSSTSWKASSFSPLKRAAVNALQMLPTSERCPGHLTHTSFG